MPQPGCVELRQRRQRVRGRPRAVERLDAAAATTASQNALPCSYWRSLRSSPIRRSNSRNKPERSRRRRSRPSRSTGQVGQQRSPDGVHDVLGVALDQRHRGLQLVEQRAALRPGDEVDELAGADRVDERRADRPACGSRSSLRTSTSTSSDASSPRMRSASVPAQPRHAAELQRVRGLVQRDPAQRAPRRRPSARGRRRRGSGPTNSSRAGASGSSSGNSYWPSTRAGEEAPTARRPRPPAAPPSASAAGRRAGPAPRPAASATGSRTVRIERRLVAAQPARSTVSGSGSAVGGRRAPCSGRPARALRAAKSSTSAAAAGRARTGGSATRRATRSASPQSIIGALRSAHPSQRSGSAVG